MCGNVMCQDFSGNVAATELQLYCKMLHKLYEKVEVCMYRLCCKQNGTCTVMS